MVPRRTRWFTRALVALGLAAATVVGSAAIASAHPVSRPAPVADGGSQASINLPYDWWW